MSTASSGARGACAVRRGWQQQLLARGRFEQGPPPILAGLLTRYNTTLERSMYRVIWDLREMQAMRADSRAEPKRPPGFRG